MTNQDWAVVGPKNLSGGVTETMSGQDWAVWEQDSLSRRARSRHSPGGVKVTMSGQDWAVWE